VYALTKLAGEHAALAYGEGALVVRGAGLYGLHGSASKGGNFVQRMLARAAGGAGLKMVADQRLQPTFTADLASAVVEAADRDVSGVLHLTAAGACSWFDFTQAIMEIAAVEVDIEPVQTTIPPGGVDRPLNGVLARPPRRHSRPHAAAAVARGARGLHAARGAGGRAGLRANRPRTRTAGRPPRRPASGRSHRAATA
jgi:dTDP-4-dehydrorhamnose reductase